MSDMPLTRHLCAEGGVLCELYREEGFGQLNLRTVPIGATAGEHIHEQSDEWWVIARGEAVVTLKWSDGNMSVKRAKGDTPHVLEVPRNVWHKIENVGLTEVVLIYWTSQVYDPKQVDKVATWNTP